MEGEQTQESVLLNQLRTILLKEDRGEVDVIKQTLNTHAELKKKIDPIFDEKIQDLKSNFSAEFGTLVNEAIEEKLEESKEQILNLIYPVLGQMIRKFVGYQFQQLKDSIDERVQSTFSSKGILGQIKSRLFGIKSSDIVLSDLDIPVIEEIYVIERDSGLLIGSYSLNETMDRDMIAGMLTAIKSFVEDAFQHEKQELDLIQYGNYKIWIQNFYQYYIAVAITGSLSAKEKDDLNEHLLEFSEHQMNLNLQVIDTKLNDDVSERLEKAFSKPIFA